MVQYGDKCVCDTSTYLMPDGQSCTYYCSTNNYVIDISGKQCITQCGQNQVMIYSNDVYQYACFCETDMMVNLQRNACVSSCQQGEVTQIYGVATADFIYTFCGCGSSTPIMSVDNQQCLTTCPKGQILNIPLSQCVFSCGYLVQYEEQCYDVCPPGLYVDIKNTSSCVTCETSQVAVYSYGAYCYCPSGSYLFYDYSSSTSSYTCIECNEQNQYLYDIGGVSICTTYCYEVVQQEGSQMRCQYSCDPGFVNSSSSLCSPICSSGILDFNNKCVSQCAVGETVEGEYFTQCECGENEYYSNNQCVTQCGEEELISSDGRSCVAQCPKNEYIDLSGTGCTSNLGSYVATTGQQLICYTYTPPYVIRLDGKDCTQQCGIGQILINGRCQCAQGLIKTPDDAFCICQNPNYFIQDTKCVSTCDSGQNLFNKSNNQKVCILQSCASGYVGYQRVKCVQFCTPFYFISSDGKSCVDFCAVGQVTLTTSQCGGACDHGYPTVGAPWQNYQGVCRCPHVLAMNQSCASWCDANERLDNYSRCQCQSPLQLVGSSCQCPSKTFIRYATSSGWYSQDSTVECVEEKECNAVSGMLALNGVCKCTNGYYYSQVTWVQNGSNYTYVTTYNCTSQCGSSAPTFLDISQTYCSYSCDDYYQNTLATVCLSTCPSNSYAITQQERWVDDAKVGLLPVDGITYSKCMCNKNLYPLQDGSCGVCYQFVEYSSCVSNCSYGMYDVENQTKVCIYSCNYGFIEEQSMKQCVQCNATSKQYMSRDTQMCLKSCNFYNVSNQICEDLGSQYCPMVQLIGGQKQCVFTCLSGFQQQDTECVGSEQNGQKIGIWVGVGLGGLALVGLLAGIIVLVIKNRKLKKMIPNQMMEITKGMGTLGMKPLDGPQLV